MVALNETTSEPGLRRISRGCRGTATYPQGTSQMPPGTTNYLYYTSSWQLIEVRTDGTSENQLCNIGEDPNNAAPKIICSLGMRTRS